MTTSTDAEMRKEVLRRLQGVGAHMAFEEAVKDFPMDRINEKFPNGTYSAYALIEHLRRGQWDMLDYCKNPNYQHIKWPDDYWPDESFQATPADWDKTVREFLRDRHEFEAMAQDPSVDLNATVPSHPEHTILREMLQTAAHNAYHVGEFAIMRQVMGTWPADRGSK